MLLPHTEAETGPAFTQLQEELPAAVSVHSLSSAFPGCSFLDLAQDQSPGKQLGLLVQVRVGFAVGLKRIKRITTDRITSFLHPPNFLTIISYLLLFQLCAIDLLEINKILSISLGKKNSKSKRNK